MTSYTNVFGGTVIYPAEVSYRAFSLSANTQLAWPTELATDTNVVSQIMDVTPTGAGFSILMPAANDVSVGETTLIFNVGSSAFTVKTSTGVTIASISPGLAWQIYLTGNTTASGTWRAVQYGAGVSSANAASLSGYGIKAIANTLNQSAAVTSLNSNYVLNTSDRAQVRAWAGGAGSFTLTSAATLGNDWFCYVRNNGTGALTVSAPGGESIDGSGSVTYNPGDSSLIICDGSNFFTIGFGQAPEFTFDYVAISLTGQTSPYVLSGAELNRISYNFSGVLTTNMVVVVPDTVQQYWVANTTTGAYTLTIKTVSGSGVVVAQGARSILYSDGVDMYSAETGGLAIPVTIAQGGTGATTAGGALVNLGGTSTGLALFTSASPDNALTDLGATVLGKDLLKAVDADSALTDLGGTATGKDIFSASDTAAVWATLGSAPAGVVDGGSF